MDAPDDPMIRLTGVGKTYPGGTVAVQELDLDVPRGELVTLVGPSGCGKSTTLKMINRLIEPTTGRIQLGGDDVTRINPVQLRRRIGYVIQQIGLFPHLTVAANIGVVPRLLGWPSGRIDKRIDELLDMVHLPPARESRRCAAAARPTIPSDSASGTASDRARPSTSARSRARGSASCPSPSGAERS